MSHFICYGLELRIRFVGSPNGKGEVFIRSWNEKATLYKDSMLSGKLILIFVEMEILKFAFFTVSVSRIKRNMFAIQIETRISFIVFFKWKWTIVFVM